MTDTRTASGTKLELPAEPDMHGLTFEEWSSKFAHWYSMEDQNVYFEPSFQAPVIGYLSINDEVKITGDSTNYDAIYNYPPYDMTESPTDIRWYRIDYNEKTGYVPSSYIWRNQRDTSIALNPQAANYPTLDGLGSGVFYPNDSNWYYIYGIVGTTVKLNPACTSMEIYDGPNKNVIGTITDTNVILQLTNQAYATNVGGRVGSYYIYEVYYNGDIAYVDSLTAFCE